MPPEEYEADMDAVTRMYEDAYECTEHEDVADRLDEILDDIRNGEPAMEPEPEPEPEPEEQVELSLGEIRIDGDKFSSVAGSQKERVEQAFMHANRIWSDRGEPIELELYVDRVSVKGNNTKNLCRKISVMFNRTMDLDEGIFPEELAESDWVRTWLEENDIPGERFKEREREDGMSWVHINITNPEKNDETVGGVTACIRPGETSRHVEVSFAFCRGSIPFNKRQGRIISRKRMDEGVTMKVIMNTSRYATVKDIVRRSLHGEKMWNCVEDNATDTFPHWLYPNYREDIPDDVQELLEKIYTDVDTKSSVRDEIAPMLSRNIKDRADVKLWEIINKKA